MSRGSNNYQPKQQGESWELGDHIITMEDLPLSPCLKIKSSGVIHFWSEALAGRPDLCVNCDETGNEDPAAWQGRGPKGMNMSPKVFAFKDEPPVPESPAVEKIPDPVMPALTPQEPLTSPVETVAERFGVATFNSWQLEETKGAAVPFDGVPGATMEEFCTQVREKIGK